VATILYLTDLYYKANGRNYHEEDLYITSRLKDQFDVLIGHPQQAISYLDCAELIVFRNTGPVMWYKDYFSRFVQAVNEKGLTTFNSFDGKADQRGKDYLLQLTTEGYPVIPTIDNLDDIALLGVAGRYLVKQKDGADSIGMQVLDKEELLQHQLSQQLIQPYVDFEYEVSFYYLNNKFQYALYAPNKQQRWQLQEYKATEEDLFFADRFMKWNNMTRGIARVDACRLQDGSLLLVELEDLNPYLSLDVLDEKDREQFISDFTDALKNALHPA
jgi:hypothetical protein